MVPTETTVLATFKSLAKKVNIPPFFNYEEISAYTQRKLTPWDDAKVFMKNGLNSAVLQKELEMIPIEENLLVAQRKNSNDAGKMVSIIKIDTRYFYTYKKLSSLQSIFSKFNLCSSCNRCRALPTNQGGCDKVLHKVPSKAIISEKGRNIFSYEEGKRLERYPFITAGVETLGIITFSQEGHIYDDKSYQIYTFSCDNFIPFSSKAKKEPYRL